MFPVLTNKTAEETIDLLMEISKSIHIAEGCDMCDVFEDWHVRRVGDRMFVCTGSTPRTLSTFDYKESCNWESSHTPHKICEYLSGHELWCLGLGGRGPCILINEKQFSGAIAKSFWLDPRLDHSPLMRIIAQYIKTPEGKGWVTTRFSRSILEKSLADHKQELNSIQTRLKNLIYTDAEMRTISFEDARARLGFDPSEKVTSLKGGVKWGVEKKNASDPVKNPSHYTSGKIEVWDFIVDQKLDYCSGCAVKYITRAGKKDQATHVQDLEKAVAYLKRLLEDIKVTRPTRYNHGKINVISFVQDQGLSYVLGRAVRLICDFSGENEYAKNIEKAIYFVNLEIDKKKEQN